MLRADLGDFRGNSDQNADGNMDRKYCVHEVSEGNKDPLRIRQEAILVHSGKEPVYTLSTP
jgi:hypothetical protein